MLHATDRKMVELSNYVIYMVILITKSSCLHILNVLCCCDFKGEVRACVIEGLVKKWRSAR